MKLTHKFDWISSDEVCKEYGIHERDLIRFALEDILHPRLIGDDEYWNREELERVISQYSDEEVC
jgi:hypothetical protein